MRNQAYLQSHFLRELKKYVGILCCCYDLIPSYDIIKKSKSNCCCRCRSPSEISKSPKCRIESTEKEKFYVQFNQLFNTSFLAGQLKFPELSRALYTSIL